MSREVIIAALNGSSSKITVKDILAYLELTIKEKEATIQSCKAISANPSVRDMLYKAEGVKDFAEYLKMAIKANAPHYLK